MRVLVYISSHCELVSFCQCACSAAPYTCFQLDHLIVYCMHYVAFRCVEMFEVHQVLTSWIILHHFVNLSHNGCYISDTTISCARSKPCANYVGTIRDLYVVAPSWCLAYSTVPASRNGRNAPCIPTAYNVSSCVYIYIYAYQDLSQNA